jgi:hypothetical protein
MPLAITWQLPSICLPLTRQLAQVRLLHDGVA